MAFDSLISKLEEFRAGLNDTARDILVDNEEVLIEEQREQLFEGKSSTGADLRPSYTEDIKPKGYFNSVEKAKNYANWKANVVSYPSTGNLKRDIDAPNLYVNGRFHSELGIEFGADAVQVIGTTAYAQGIIAKYGHENFGWTVERMSRILQEIVLPALQEKLRYALNG